MSEWMNEWVSEWLLRIGCDPVNRPVTEVPVEQKTAFHLDGFLFIYYREKNKNTELTTKQNCVIILFPDQIRARGMPYHQRDYLGGTETGSFIKWDNLAKRKPYIRLWALNNISVKNWQIFHTRHQGTKCFGVCGCSIGCWAEVTQVAVGRAATCPSGHYTKQFRSSFSLRLAGVSFLVIWRQQDPPQPHREKVLHFLTWVQWPWNSIDPEWRQTWFRDGIPTYLLGSVPRPSCDLEHVT